MGLKREEILKQTCLPLHVVKVPEWGGDVYVRVMTGKERDAFEYMQANERRSAKEAGEDYSPENIRARIAAMLVCNETGERLFTEEDIPALGALHCGALDRVWDEAMRVNHMLGDEVENKLKNSDTAPSISSGTK